MNTNANTLLLERLTSGPSPTLSELMGIIPDKFLNEPVGRIGFPKRFFGALKDLNIRNLNELKNFKDFAFNNLENVGAKTVVDAVKAISDYLVKKISLEEDGYLTVIGEMEEFAEELTARDAQIWRERMGLTNERMTLESIGNRWDLTRERVRQIESILFGFYSKQYAAASVIKEYLDSKEFDTLSVEEMARDLHPILDDMVAPYAPLSAILENFKPKMYIVESPSGFVISRVSKTKFNLELAKIESKIERVFRNSQRRLNKDDFRAALKKESPDLVEMSLIKSEKVGYWDLDGTMISPDSMHINFAIGLLQGTKSAIHVDDLAEMISEYLGEEVSPVSLRGTIFSLPQIHSFGRGCVGLKGHFQMREEDVRKVKDCAERIINSGKKTYQWSAKDLVVKIFDEINIRIDHHQLRLALMDSDKVKYLGRLTWVKSGGLNRRLHYREIFSNILLKAGKPLTEEELVEATKKVRGLHYTVHLRNDPSFVEVKPNTWDLRDRQKSA